MPFEVSFSLALSLDKNKGSRMDLFRNTIRAAIQTATFLIDRAKCMRDAVPHKNLLYREAHSLLGSLELLDMHVRSTSRDPAWQRHHESAMQQLEATYNELQGLLRLNQEATEPFDGALMEAFQIRGSLSCTTSQLFSLLERVARLREQADVLVEDKRDEFPEWVQIASAAQSDELLGGSVPKHFAVSTEAAADMITLLQDILCRIDSAGKKADQEAMSQALIEGIRNRVHFLVTCGVGVALAYAHGKSLLLLAAERGWHDVASLIVQQLRTQLKEATPGSSTSQLCLLAGAYDDSSELIERFLNDREVATATGPRDDRLAATALWLAVERGHFGVVHSMGEAGVNLDLRDNLQQTALHRAARQNKSILVETLVYAGATVDAKDRQSLTPWAASLDTANPALLDFLLEAGADPCTRGRQGVSPLYGYAAAGNTSMVKYMLDSGTDPSICTMFRWAPLHWAANHGHMDCVKLLCDAGAELSPVSDQNKTPLDLCIANNKTEMVEFLQAAGAKRYQDLDIKSESSLSTQVSQVTRLGSFKLNGRSKQDG